MERVKPTTMTGAIYRDPADGKWYWTLPYYGHPVAFKRPVGPFLKREDARADYRYVMGITTCPNVQPAHAARNPTSRND